MYHPDLLNYTIEVGGALSQQHIDSDGVPPWSSDTLDEYLVSAGCSSDPDPSAR